jgi:hypothetical protein
MILFAPFVEQKNRGGWETYAVESQGWIEQDYVSVHREDNGLSAISTHLVNFLFRNTAVGTRQTSKQFKKMYTLAIGVRKMIERVSMTKMVLWRRF